MNKGTKISLIVLAVLAVACLGGVMFMFNNATNRMTEVKAQAKADGDEMIVLLAGSWDYESIVLRTSPKMGTEEEVVQKMELWKEKLGDLVKSEGLITGTRYDLDDKAGAVVYADYTAQCEFDNGMATIVLEMSREPGNKWLLDGFSVTPSESSSPQSSE